MPSTIAQLSRKSQFWDNKTISLCSDSDCCETKKVFTTKRRHTDRCRECLLIVMRYKCEVDGMERELVERRLNDSEAMKDGV